jgi:hypothetical protein
MTEAMENRAKRWLGSFHASKAKDVSLDQCDQPCSLARE